MSIVPSSRVFRLSLLMLLLAVLGTLWRSRTESAPDVSDQSVADSRSSQQSQWESIIATEFAGDDACEVCHSEESAAHQRSGHSQTAFRMEDSELARQLDGTHYTDPEDGRTVSFRLSSRGFFAEVHHAGRTVRNRVDWLLGSSAHAQTAVSIFPETNAGLEHCWTWLAHRNELGRTPGQPDFAGNSDPIDTCDGRQMTGDDVVHCFSCHMTFGPAPGQPLAKVRWHPNINCERCHGPRRQHVLAAHRGQADAVQPMVNLKDPQVEMALCAQCHRGTQEVDDSIAESDRVRFQPYRLEQSRCFQNNPAALTCSTCHDSHDATSHDVTRYRNACLKCHSREEQVHCAEIESSQFASSNCVKCHMPKQQWSGGIEFVDHWIRVVHEVQGDQ